MAVTAFVYGGFLQSVMNKEVDLDSDSIKVMLVTSSYTPNQDTHRYRSSVVANEVSGSGYTAGGSALSNKSVSYSAGNNTFTFDADDVTWTPSTITARYAVFYDSTPGSSATDPLIAYWDFGADVTSSNGPFTLTINASGIFTATVA